MRILLVSFVFVLFCSVYLRAEQSLAKRAAQTGVPSAAAKTYTAFDAANMPEIKALAGPNYRVYNSVSMSSSDNPQEVVKVKIVLSRLCVGLGVRHCEAAPDRIKMIVLPKDATGEEVANAIAHSSSFLTLEPGAVPVSPTDSSVMGHQAWRTFPSIKNSYVAIRKNSSGEILLRHVYHSKDTKVLLPPYAPFTPDERSPVKIWHGYLGNRPN